jgi:transcription antitermination factor NusG
MQNDDGGPLYRVPNWYAIYVCSRHEKRVAVHLQHLGIEHLLPLYTSVRRWKDRRKILDLPLFPGYVFVRLALRDRLKVLEIPSVVRFIEFHGHPAPLAENDVEALRAGLSNRLKMEPHPYLKVGRRVRVTAGPLAGSEGILVRRKDKYRVVLSIDLIMRSVAVEVDLMDVEPMLSEPARVAG